MWSDGPGVTAVEHSGDCNTPLQSCDMWQGDEILKVLDPTGIQENQQTCSFPSLCPLT